MKSACFWFRSASDAVPIRIHALDIVTHISTFDCCHCLFFLSDFFFFECGASLQKLRKSKFMPLQPHGKSMTTAAAAAAAAAGSEERS